MPQGTPADPIDWHKIGSPDCDAGAQTEALRAMGLNPDATVIHARDANTALIGREIPALTARDSRGNPLLDAAGNTYWAPELDIARIGLSNGRSQITAQRGDGVMDIVELEAAVIAAAQVARRRGVTLENVTLQEIVEGMRQPLNQIMGNSPPPRR